MPKPTLLLIDDEEKLRKLLARILELEGYPVVRAANARQGLEALDKHPEAALVITDVRLPDGNGLDLLQKVKARRPPTVKCWS